MCQRGWVCPAVAEVTLGVLGGDSWPQALWWGCPTVSLGGHLVADSSGIQTFSSHQGVQHHAGERGVPHGDLFLLGPAGPDGHGDNTCLVAPGVRAVTAAWGLLQRLRALQGRECPCKPSLAFWGHGTGVRETWGCH